MEAFLVPVLGIAVVAVLRIQDRRWLRRAEAEGHPTGIERWRLGVATDGTAIVVLAVAGPPAAALVALGSPRPVVVLALVPLVALALRVSNALARRRPDLGLTVLRWPDELRTVRTPAGRVGVGLLAIVAVTLVLAVTAL